MRDGEVRQVAQEGGLKEGRNVTEKMRRVGALPEEGVEKRMMNKGGIEIRK